MKEIILSTLTGLFDILKYVGTLILACWLIYIMPMNMFITTLIIMGIAALLFLSYVLGNKMREEKRRKEKKKKEW